VPEGIDAFRRLAGVFIDCGTRDEHELRWGARMIAAALRDGGVPVEHQEFEDGHTSTSYRYDASLRWIVPRLART
jgi:predicted esterase